MAAHAADAVCARDVRRLLVAGVRLLLVVLPMVGAAEDGEAASEFWAPLFWAGEASWLAMPLAAAAAAVAAAAAAAAWLF